MPEQFDNGSEKKIKKFGTEHDSIFGSRNGLPRSAKSALALKIAGASYREIADTLDYANATAARSAVEAILAESYDEQTDVRALRQVAILQLDGLLKSVWTKATDNKSPEHLQNLRAAREIIDRRLKLTGADAPTQITVHNPDAEEFEAMIATVAKQLDINTSGEADILALEEGEGGVWEVADGDEDDRA